MPGRAAGARLVVMCSRGIADGCGVQLGSVDMQTFVVDKMRLEQEGNHEMLRRGPRRGGVLSRPDRVWPKGLNHSRWRTGPG
jgi:hypothetical protein